jgi:hypothetical protein
MHMAVANGVDPYRPSHLRELAAHASVDRIRPRAVRARLAWWEMDRLACDLLKHRREDPENYDDREPLWMRREQLRRRYCRVSAPEDRSRALIKS